MILLLEDVKLRLDALKDQLEEIRGGLRIQDLQQELTELKEEMAAPGFWDDLERSTQVNKRIAAIENKINHFTDLTSQRDDLEVMVELIQEEEDEGAARELDAELDELTEKTEVLSLETLMRGEYDQ